MTLFCVPDPVMTLFCVPDPVMTLFSNPGPEMTLFSNPGPEMTLFVEPTVVEGQCCFRSRARIVGLELISEGGRGTRPEVLISRKTNNPQPGEKSSIDPHPQLSENWWDGPVFAGPEGPDRSLP